MCVSLVINVLLFSVRLTQKKEVSRQFVSEVFAGAIMREQSKLLSSSTSHHDAQKAASKPNALSLGQSKMSGSSALLPVSFEHPPLSEKEGFCRYFMRARH